eukprot:3106493-Rhodomonas_salina.1
MVLPGSAEHRALEGGSVLPTHHTPKTNQETVLSQTGADAKLLERNTSILRDKLDAFVGLEGADERDQGVGLVVLRTEPVVRRSYTTVLSRRHIAHHNAVLRHRTEPGVFGTPGGDHGGEAASKADGDPAVPAERGGGAECAGGRPVAKRGPPVTRR